MARNLRRFPPKPQRSANFIRSLAGSEPGLRMKTIGELGVLCSKMASKLIIGGCTYLPDTAARRAQAQLGQCSLHSGCWRGSPRRTPMSGPLPLMGETWAELQALAFSLVQAQPLHPPREQTAEYESLLNPHPCSALSFFLSNKRTLKIQEQQGTLMGRQWHRQW